MGWGQGRRSLKGQAVCQPRMALAELYRCIGNRRGEGDGFFLGGGGGEGVGDGSVLRWVFYF